MSALTNTWVIWAATLAVGTAEVAYLRSMDISLYSLGLLWAYL